MILEANRKRVVISEVSREEGPDKRRTLGELIYQLGTDTGWCDAVVLEQNANRVSVTLRGRSGGTSVAGEIDDLFLQNEHGVTIHRTWRLPDAGRYRLYFDYRLNTASDGIILPAFLYALPATHSLRTPIVVSEDRLSTPAVLYIGPELSQSIVRIPSAPPTADSAQEKTYDGTYEIYLSEGFPAVQIRLPGDEANGHSGGCVVVRRRSGPHRITATFRIEVQRDAASQLLTRAHEATWDPGLPDRQEHSLVEFIRVRQVFVDGHLETYRGQPAGVRPARDDRTGNPPAVLTAVAPYGGLDAAETQFLSAGQFHEPDRLVVAAAISEFFCAGLQPDGSFCDAFDPQTRRWGTLRPGTAGVQIGACRLSQAAEAGTRLVRLYDQLRRSGHDIPRIVRTTGEIAEYCIRHQTGDGEYGEPLGTVVSISLLCALQEIRGTNSTRSASLRRAAAYLVRMAEDPERFLTIAGSRAVSVKTLRATLDLLDLRANRSLPPVVEAAGAAVLGWVVTRDLRFPRNSAASRLRVRTAGMTVTSTDRRHLDFDGLPIALELFRWSRALADPAPAEVARVIVRASMQLVSGLTGGPGSVGDQPAEVDFVDWSSQRRFGPERGRVLGSRVGQASASIIAAYDIARLFPQELPFHAMPNSRSNRS
ncbi:MAG: hypothetical protein V3S41_03465 [Spirochaetia bacterium]